MKLCILKARNDLPDDVTPFFPPSDVCFSMIVRAGSEDAARRWAAQTSFNEGKQAWLNEQYSSCKPLHDDGTGGVVLQYVFYD